MLVQPTPLSTVNGGTTACIPVKEKKKKKNEHQLRAEKYQFQRRNYLNGTVNQLV